MSDFLGWALSIAMVMLVLAMLFAMFRLLRGPSAQDRVLALDCLNVNAMLLMLTLTLSWRSSMYFEAALLIALFGFVSSTAIAKFLLRGEVIE